MQLHQKFAGRRRDGDRPEIGQRLPFANHQRIFIHEGVAQPAEVCLAVRLFLEGVTEIFRGGVGGNERNGEQGFARHAAGIVGLREDPLNRFAVVAQVLDLDLIAEEGVKGRVRRQLDAGDGGRALPGLGRRLHLELLERFFGGGKILGGILAPPFEDPRQRRDVPGLRGLGHGDELLHPRIERGGGPIRVRPGEIQEDERAPLGGLQPQLAPEIRGGFAGRLHPEGDTFPTGERPDAGLPLEAHGAPNGIGQVPGFHIEAGLQRQLIACPGDRQDIIARLHARGDAEGAEEGAVRLARRLHEERQLIHDGVDDAVGAEHVLPPLRLEHLIRQRRATAAVRAVPHRFHHDGGLHFVFRIDEAGGDIAPGAAQQDEGHDQPLKPVQGGQIAPHFHIGGRWRRRLAPAGPRLHRGPASIGIDGGS